MRLEPMAPNVTMGMGPASRTVLQKIYFRDRPDLTPQILSIYLEGAESLKKHFRRIEVSR